MSKWFDPALLPEEQREKWERDRRRFRQTLIAMGVVTTLALLLGAYAAPLNKPRAVEIVSYSPAEVCVKHLGALYDNAVVSITQCAYPEPAADVDLAPGTVVQLVQPDRTKDKRSVFVLTPLP